MVAFWKIQPAARYEVGGTILRRTTARSVTDAAAVMCVCTANLRKNDAAPRTGLALCRIAARRPPSDGLSADCACSAHCTLGGRRRHYDSRLAQRAEPSREIAPHCRDQEPDRHHRLGHRPRRSGDWGAPHTSFASDNCAISERHILRNCTDPTAPIVMADTPVTPAAISPSMRASAATTAKNATMGLRIMSKRWPILQPNFE
jgi:hypothetical protein